MYLYFKKLTIVGKQSSNRPNFDQSGHPGCLLQEPETVVMIKIFCDFCQFSAKKEPETDVMITIFCNFCQFWAKKIDVFLKNQSYEHSFLQNYHLFESKTPFFSPNFSAKIFLKITTSVAALQ
jgi:hypothetical protein